MEKFEIVIGNIMALTQCAEVNILFGTLEYVIDCTNFITKLGGFDIEARFLKQLSVYRDWYQGLCMQWAMHLVRMHIEVSDRDAVKDNRLTVYMYTHTAFADAMISSN